MNFACVLKTGGIYTAAHVERLRAMLWQPVTCLTDDPEVTGPKIALKHGWPGWWSKLELFEHDLGHVCYLDLDVTVQHLDWLAELDPAVFYGMRDAYEPDGSLFNSSVMVWSGKRPDLVEGITAQDMQHPGGDQQWIWRKLNESKPVAQLLRRPDVASYKKHGKRPEFGVVVYHGQPKPWDVAEFEHELLALFPNSKMPRPEQYNVAWGALHTDVARYSAGERAHAKCWLTYRTLDGEVTYDSWKKNVAVVAIPSTGQPKMDARWQTSQAAAEVFLKIQEGEEWQPAAQSFLDTATLSPLLTENPGSCLNLARVGCLLAYQRMLEGNEEAAASIISECFRLWGETWTKIDPMENPYRYVEMRQDSAALYAMSRIMHQMGRVKVYFFKPAWAENLFKEQEKTLWWRCMVRLGRQRGVMW